MTDRSLPDDVAMYVVESAPDGLVMVDAAGLIVLLNRQAEVLFGYERAELIGQPIEVLIPEERRLSHEHDRANYTASPRTRAMGVAQNLHGRRRDGDTFPLEVSLSPIDTGDDLFVVAAVRDVRERRLAQELLADARRRTLLLEDRERVGRDLHDSVIQELFATGMNLQAVIPAIDDPSVAERVTEAIDAIDSTIGQIRETIFGLTGSAGTGHGARDKIDAVVGAFAEILGFDPSTEFVGDLHVLPVGVAEHLVPTVREALSNAARHARASEVHVEVRAESGAVSLEVIDNGIGVLGPTHQPGGRGLRNMQDRAAALGGSFSVEAQPEGGTRLRWRVPRSGAGPIDDD